jgi:hypothetical protein
MTESQAREIHRLRKPTTTYAAIFGNPTSPTHRVKVTFGAQGLMFYEPAWIDTHGRKLIEYQFREIDGRLFLSSAYEFWYEGDADRAVRKADSVFAPDGRVTVVKVDRKTMIRSTRTLEYDVTGNWEPIPEFGDYDGVLAKERGSVFRLDGK